jgi:hypothetical protein
MKRWPAPVKFARVGFSAKQMRRKAGFSGLSGREKPVPLISDRDFGHLFCALISSIVLNSNVPIGGEKLRVSSI